jgi:hypothetical protein
MKLLNRAVPLSVATIIGVIVGIAIATTFSFPSANAAPQSGFVLTGVLSIPGSELLAGDRRGAPVNRIEDKEAGVICYMWEKGFVLGCVKK